MTGIIAAIVEAFGELRVNKGRIILALIGVAFSVFALTGVIGGGTMMQGALEQADEQSSGRRGTIEVTGELGQTTRADDEVLILEQFNRFEIEHRSRSFKWGVLRIQTPQGTFQLQANGIDPDYKTIFRLDTVDGRWFAPSDSKRLAPAVVVNRGMYRLLGEPALDGAVLTAYGEGSSKELFTIIGVVDDGQGPIGYSAYYLVDDAQRSPLLNSALESSSPSYVGWAPQDMSVDIARDMSGAFAAASNNRIFAQSNLQWGIANPFDVIGLGVLAVAGVILLLGALGLLNIALVTIRYRVREIGIRRSYGATGGRIFVGVLMESIVATAVAGAIGVTLAVALLRSPWFTKAMRDVGLVDVPPFPVTAVLIGMGTAIGVGFLAGVIPAIIATRIKVIDAIRT